MYLRPLGANLADLDRLYACSFEEERERVRLRDLEWARDERRDLLRSLLRDLLRLYLAGAWGGDLLRDLFFFLDESSFLVSDLGLDERDEDVDTVDLIVDLDLTGLGLRLRPVLAWFCLEEEEDLDDLERFDESVLDSDFDSIFDSKLEF